MTRSAEVHGVVAGAVEVYLESREGAILRDLLLRDAGLPGPRANLELADAFAAILRRFEARDRAALLGICREWTRLSPVEAPTNDPREFLVFCGTRGIGALGTASDGAAEDALKELRVLARDPRWRVREAVAMGIQDLLGARPSKVLLNLREWIRPGAWLEMRAVAAGIAEPRLLASMDMSREAIMLHRSILACFATAKDRGSEDFRVLRQGLGYSISVVVAARPKDGFAWLEGLSKTDDPDVVWVLRENLKKNRLAKAFPRKIAALDEALREKSARRVPL